MKKITITLLLSLIIALLATGCEVKKASSSQSQPAPEPKKFSNENVTLTIFEDKKYSVQNLNSFPIRVRTVQVRDYYDTERTREMFTLAPEEKRELVLEQSHIYFTSIYIYNLEGGLIGFISQDNSN